MLTAVDDGTVQPGSEALNRLKSTEPPLYLTPSPELSRAARSASEYLFSSLNPFAPKSPFPRLLTEGFDAEQIWQQIDLQSQPLLSSIRRHVRNFEKNPDEIKKLFNFEHKEADLIYENGYDSMDLPDKELKGLESEGFDDGTDDNEEGEGEDTSEDDEEDLENANGVEDRHFKLKELEEYLEEDEAREYGLKNEKDKKNNKSKRGEVAYEDEESEDEFGDEDGEDEENDEDDELGVMGLDDKNGEWMEEVKYDDFFGRKGTGKKKNSNNFGESHHLGTDDEDDDPNNNMGSGSLIKDDPNNHNDNQKKQTLSTHEQERENLRYEIEKMEKANLEPKTWTMQGEVTAAKRPKNSALEVDLDFEHNVRPAPVITEEVTASLEELIQKRVVEGLFDDVQKPPTLSNKAPREKVEMDESKSKKGLAELYEDEYAQKTGLVSTALTFSDEQKKEANLLFKKLCLKLDALSHFHFTPKPVIEDMSIQANVPALAMEEIAPLAVSDAAMLAPQEVFAGKGDIKEETELTKAERKRRRSNKKRKYKAEAVKTQRSAFMNQKNGNEDSRVMT